MDLFTKTHPNATLQEQHDNIFQDQKTWNLFLKSKECISALGINPDAIAPLNPDVQQAIAVPEFGSLALIVITISLIGVITISARFRFFQKF